ncbi:DUF2071 domain-containing protein [Ktedonospora formicarum]|uniref:DUF2071 domain-containing protein n=1 Tax=Ktedonospora formicarum TaxID=2778364 RepID=UPI001C68C349|nr:DUF2071 domain-containing protein [Ktedonospora formicarum]
MLFSRSVHAQLVERFIFNFRVKPDVLASHLPVSYLHPQVLQGWSVVSFCFLKLEHVMISSLPSWLGLKTISCAYRCGVSWSRDTFGSEPVPSVYVFGRYADHALISHLGPCVFSSTLPHIDVSLSEDDNVRTLRVSDNNQQCLFSASIQPTASQSEWNSQVFASLESFVRFIELGLTSYASSSSGEALLRIDLQEQGTQYEAINATVIHSSPDTAWPNSELIFDSAVRATGGLYKWTYRGIYR